MISIFKKELRDCLRWVPAGMLIAMVMVWQALPNGFYEAFNFETDLMQPMGWAAALIAFGLGLLQSLFDIRNEARGYLLHRPVETSAIFWAKIFSGFVAYVLSLAPAVLLATFYLGSRGLENMPVSPLQVIPSVLLTLSVFLLHPVAIWISNRDARWVGTRALPLAGVAMVIAFVIGAYTNFPMLAGRNVVLILMLIWVSNLAAFAVVLTAARHAFCRRQMLPPRSEKQATSWASLVAITFSSIVLVTVVTVTVGLAFQSPTGYANYTSRELQMNSAGEFEQVQIRRSSWSWDDVEFAVRPAQSTEDFVPVGDAWEFPEYSQLGIGQSSEYSWFQQFNQYGNFNQGTLQLLHHQGRMLAYRENQLAAIIAPQGVSRDGQWPKGKFQNLKIADNIRTKIDGHGQVTANPFMVDATGVSQLDTDTLEVRQVTSQAVERLCMLFAGDENPATLWTANGDSLTRHSISPVEDEKSLNEEAIGKGVFLLPLVKVDDSTTFKIDSLDATQAISVFRADDGRYGYVRFNYKTTEHFYGMLEDDGSVSTVGPVVVAQLTPPSQNAFSVALPPIMVFASGVIHALTPITGVDGSNFAIIAFGIAQALCVALGTFLICKMYDVDGRQQLLWTIVGALGGWGVWLAVVACHRRLVKEACPSCQKPTRVDMETCTHCEKSWLPPELDQIEIFDSAGQFVA